MITPLMTLLLAVPRTSTGAFHSTYTLKSSMLTCFQWLVSSGVMILRPLGEFFIFKLSWRVLMTLALFSAVPASFSMQCTSIRAFNAFVQSLTPFNWSGVRHVALMGEFSVCFRLTHFDVPAIVHSHLCIIPNRSACPCVRSTCLWSSRRRLAHLSAAMQSLGEFSDFSLFRLVLTICGVFAAIYTSTSAHGTSLCSLSASPWLSTLSNSSAHNTVLPAGKFGILGSIWHVLTFCCAFAAICILFASLCPPALSTTSIDDATASWMRDIFVYMYI